jgi:hypothetical protein
VPEKVTVAREIPHSGLRPLEPFDVTVLGEAPPEREELLEAVQKLRVHLLGEGDEDAASTLDGF